MGVSEEVADRVAQHRMHGSLNLRRERRKVEAQDLLVVSCNENHMTKMRRYKDKGKSRERERESTVQRRGEA